MQAKLQAQYAQRGPVPEDVIKAVPFELPELMAGEVLVEVLAAPINPSDVLTLTRLSRRAKRMSISRKARLARLSSP